MEPTGQRFAWHHDTHVQLATDDSADLTAVLAQRTFAADGPDITETRLLARLADTTGKRPPLAPVRFILGRLVDAGLVDVSALPDEQVAAVGRGANSPRLSELARFNLVLD